MTKGKLYLVATPIGNLEDITFRAVKTLRVVDLILAEDTRQTGNLLKHFGIKKPQVSFFEGNEERKTAEILEKLNLGQNIALVTDAGTPLISDPGFKLVRLAIGEGFEVDSIPGPSAALTALTLSGKPCDKFLFLGYLPKRKGRQTALLKSLTTILHDIVVTMVIFESPHRLIKTLDNLKNTFGDIDIVICRELTKIHQEIRREKISQSLEHFTKVKPKGELTIVF